MATFNRPTVSKSKASKVGERIGAGHASNDDLVALENWRASHAYIINTFQATLRNRTRNTGFVVGTRLKRRTTILSKLQRFPEMQLGRMHDIAGCRIIFPTIEEMYEFREDFHKARFSHKRKDAQGRWDYIANPKDTGYRGIHDVYEYNVNSVGGRYWNGLQIEIQYRTLVQHAWATAVEVAGLLTQNSPKFGQGDPQFVEFFAVASEILARNYEDRQSCLPDLTMNQLRNRLNEIEDNLRILQMFGQVNSKVVDIDFKKNNILIFSYVDIELENETELEIRAFDKLSDALQEYARLESQMDQNADVVLVRSDSFVNMRVSFRNYFADTTEFVRMISECSL